MKRWVAVAAASVAVIGGLAFAGYRIYLNEAHDNAVRLVPPNALVYGNLFLNPSTHQKQALRDLLEKFPAAGDPEEAVGTLERYLDDALAGTGVDYSHDIEPWLGREVAVALLPPVPPGDSDTPPDVLVYAGTNDGDASMAVVERSNEHRGIDVRLASYRDVEYQVNEADGAVAGIVNDFLVVASNERSFRASVDASEGESLAETAGYRDAVAPLPRDRVSLFYASLPGFVDSLEQAGELQESFTGSVPEIRDLEPVAAAAYLRSDGVVVEVAFETGAPDAARSGVLGVVPREAWAALGIHDLGSAVRERLALLARATLGNLGPAALAAQVKAFTGLDLDDDLLAWMGNAAGFVEGTTTARGGLVVESSDSVKSASAVHELGRALAARGVPASVGEHDSTHARVVFADPTLSELIHLIAVRERVWLVFGDQTAKEIDGATLAGSWAFQDAESAMGAFSMIGYVSVDGARTFFENNFEANSGELPSDYEDKVAPNLEPLSFIGLGSRTVDGVTSYRLMIGVN